MTIKLNMVLVFLLGSMAHASEVTLVQSDNTVIRTVHLYGNSQMELETEEVEQDDSFGYALCTDKAKQLPTRQQRLKGISDCLKADNSVAIGGLA